MNLLAKARFDEARAAFRSFADAHPKDDLAPILKARPQVAHELSRALARVQALRQKVFAAQDSPTQATPEGTRWFADRLQKLFNLRSDA